MNNNRTSIKVRLENVKVVETKTDSNSIYYIIFDNDKQTDNAYFCFDRTLEHGWELLINDNYHNIQQVEIEYLKEDRGNRVINLVVLNQQF